ncbi:sodium:proton antiporter, partial [Streptomyces sparsus]
MTAAILVGVLVTGGVFLILQREMLRVTIGFVLLGHAVNVLFVAAGGMDRRGAPLLGENDPADAADPLPQAFVLTAVVITFGITVYLLALIRAGGQDQPADGDLSHGDPSGTHPSEEHASGPHSSGEHASDEHRKGAGPDRGGGASDRG